MPALRTRRSRVVATVALTSVALVGGAAAPAQADTVALAASVSAPVVTLPIGDGYRDDESLTIAASGATTASVTLQAAGGAATVVDPALPLAAGTTSISLPTDGLVAGTYAATVTTTEGTTASASFSVTALHAAVTRLVVKRSVGTVFPAKDGYRDSVLFTVTPTVSGPSSTTVTGTAALTRSGRTAKSWTLHRGTNRLTWTGKAGTRVVPGTYVLTVRAKGPQGAAKTARTSVKVSAKRLVSRTVTVAQKASTAFTRFRDFDGRPRDCFSILQYVKCESAAAQNGEPYAVVVGAVPGLPKAVRAGTAYGKPRVRIALRTTLLHGSADWGYAVGAAETSKRVTHGTSTGSWVRWSGNPSTVVLYAALKDDSTLVVDRVVFTYRYRALV